MKKAEETIGKQIFWQLPNDYRTMIEVRNNGIPLIQHAPKAAITQSIAALAEALTGDQDFEPHAPAVNKSTSLSRLFQFWPVKNRS
jgi:pilus assembly protein CpaE